MSATHAVFAARMRTLLQYRAAALSGAATQIFFGCVRLFVLRAFYAVGAEPAPLSLAQSTTYVWLSQALLVMIPWGLDREVARMVRSGDVVYELLRPVPLYRLWLARAVAVRLGPAMLRSVPVTLVAWLAFGLTLPADLATTAWFALSLLLGLWVAGAITALVSISLIWTIAGEGVAMLVNVTVWVLCGIILPLPLLPDALVPWIEALPFAAVIDAPLRIWVGDLEGAAMGRVLGRQLAWAVALTLFGRWLLSRALHRLVVQGG